MRFSTPSWISTTRNGLFAAPSVWIMASRTCPGGRLTAVKVISCGQMVGHLLTSGGKAVEKTSRRLRYARDNTTDEGQAAICSCCDGDSDWGEQLYAAYHEGLGEISHGNGGRPDRPRGHWRPGPSLSARKIGACLDRGDLHCRYARISDCRAFNHPVAHEPAHRQQIRSGWPRRLPPPGASFLIGSTRRRDMSHSAYKRAFPIDGATLACITEALR